MKVKIFTKALTPKLNFWMTKSLEPSDCGLEQEINHWLEQHPDITTKEITQSQSSFPPKVTISIWYSE